MMKNKKRIILSITACVIVLACLLTAILFLTKGNSEAKVFAPYQKGKAKEFKSGTVCENDAFELRWDQKNKRVILYDKEKDIQWSSTPEGMLNNNPIETGKKNHPQVDSPVHITYFDGVSFAEKKAYAATSAVKNGIVSADGIENGISVTYEFSKEEISVTINYTLREDNLLVSVDTSKICEGENNTLTEIAVAPFFCSVENNTDDSYLFVPSGSGALIYSDVKLANGSSTSEKVYGEDYTIDKTAEFVKYQAVRLPVYGSVSADKGVCAIIEQGAEAASICSVSNNEGLGYGAVYASFYVRGYDLIDTPSGFAATSVKSKLFSEPITDQVYEVAFYPFYGEDASYVDMANIYREYLKNKYEFGIDAPLAEAQAVNLNIVGAAEGKEFLFGVPYSKLYVTTTLKEAGQMIEEARAIAGDVNVSLEGFTESGVNIGKPAGSMKLSSKLGTSKELQKLYENYNDTGTSVFTNYDVIRFNQSGEGISTLWDSAVTTNGRQAVLTIKSQETGMPDKNQENYKLVSRNNLEKLNQNILKNASKKGIAGVGLDTLSNMAYSDYANEHYFATLGMEQQVSNILKNYKDNKVAIMGKDANTYAAVYSDYIGDVPTSSSNFDSFDVDIPFYQLVFKGYVPMSATSINLAANEKQAVLKALESGIGLNFTVLEKYDEELINSLDRDLFGTDKGNVMKLLQNLEEEGVLDILNEVKDAEITSHQIITNFVRRTEFSNGMTLYVNYGDSVYADGSVQVSAKSYYVER